jgi:hypothetical protein
MSICPPGFDLSSEPVPRPSPPHDVGDFLHYPNGLAPAQVPLSAPIPQPLQEQPPPPIANSLHMSAAGLPSHAFLDSVTALDQQPVQSDSSFIASGYQMSNALQNGLLSEVPPTNRSSASPPHVGHHPSPPMSVSAQPFPPASSLQTALDPSALPQRSRSNTLNSSPVVPLTSAISVNQSLVPTSYSPPAESLSSIKPEGSVLANASALLDQSVFLPYFYHLTCA